LIDFFYKKSNEDLGNYLEKLVAERKVTSKTELIRMAILYRLSLIQVYIEHWPKVFKKSCQFLLNRKKLNIIFIKAMAIQTLNPSYALVSIENLLRLCDEIWHQLGDNSIDVKNISSGKVL
jgi:ubiquinone biosynthesis protein COQ9